MGYEIKVYLEIFVLSIMLIVIFGYKMIYLDKANLIKLEIETRIEMILWFIILSIIPYIQVGIFVLLVLTDIIIYSKKLIDYLNKKIYNKFIGE